MNCRRAKTPKAAILSACETGGGSEYERGFEAARSEAVAMAQKHMEPRLARRLVAAADIDTAFAGFLLAMGHLRDDLIFDLGETRRPK